MLQWRCVLVLRVVYWADRNPSSPNYGVNAFNLTSASNTRLTSSKLGAVTVSGVAYDWVSGTDLSPPSSLYTAATVNGETLAGENI